MKRIKDCLFSEYPFTITLLEPTRYYAVADLAADPQIAQAYRAILEGALLGAQYEWLARFCRQRALRDIQLCVERAPGSEDYRLLERVVTQVGTGAHKTYRVDPKHASEPEYMLFRFFSFPVFELTKLQMEVISEERGWMDLMGMTWFCHRPTRAMKPCGRCFACKSVIEGGLGWRIPARSGSVSAFQKTVVGRLRSYAAGVVGRIRALRS